MKAKIQGSSGWAIHRNAMETQFQAGIGSFLGHRGGEPPDFPAYVVSFKDVNDSTDYYIRHMFVSREDFHPKPAWRLPFLTLAILAFLLVVSLQGLDTYSAYNPPPPPTVHAQVEACEEDSEKSLRECNELRAAEEKTCAVEKTRAVTTAIRQLAEPHSKSQKRLRKKLKKCQDDYDGLANSCDEDCIDLMDKKRIELIRVFGEDAKKVLTLKDSLEKKP